MVALGKKSAKPDDVYMCQAQAGVNCQVARAQPSMATNGLFLGALQERIRQLENENTQLRLQVQVLSELLSDE